MKRIANKWTISGLIMGLLVGVFWVMTLSAELNYYEPLTPAWTFIGYLTCPFLGLIWLWWWLPIALNSLLYAVLFFALHKLLLMRKLG